jgi:iron complex transport system substrate-binding protein
VGIPLVLHTAPTTFRGAYQQIRQLGLVTGHTRESVALVRSLKARIATIVRKARPTASRLSVYHELTPDLYSATSRTFVGKVYTALGLRNIADAADSVGSGYPQLSAEYVVSASPDVIVLADTVCCGQKPATVAARPGWDRVNAVRTGSIVRVHDSIASRWGPRLVDFFRAMSAALARLSR